MNINWPDFLERVLWSTVYALLSAVAVVLSTDSVTWQDGLKFVGLTTVLAILKVMAAQQAGDRNTGDAWPGGTQPTDRRGGYVPYNPNA